MKILHTDSYESIETKYVKYFPPNRFHYFIKCSSIENIKSLSCMGDILIEDDNGKISVVQYCGVDPYISNQYSLYLEIPWKKDLLHKTGIRTIRGTPSYKVTTKIQQGKYILTASHTHFLKAIDWDVKYHIIFLRERAFEVHNLEVRNSGKSIEGVIKKFPVSITTYEELL